MLNHAQECTCKACKPDAKFIPLTACEYTLRGLTFTAKEILLRDNTWLVRYTDGAFTYTIPIERWNYEARRAK